MESSDVESAYRHCAEISREKAKNFYYAFKLLPEPKRNAIYAAYAFSRNCDDLVDENPEATPDVLDVCREELRGCYAGEPEGPVAVALADTVQRYRIPVEYFEELIRGIEMDINVRRYPSFLALYQYCYRVASTVGLICLEIFGYSDQRARRFAIDLGVGMQLTNILRDLKEDIDRNRLYLPQDELEASGCQEEELLKGVLGLRYQSMMARQAKRTRDYLERSRLLFPLVAADARLCPAILNAMYSRVLDKIVASGYDVFSKRVSLSTREKLLLVANLWMQLQLNRRPAA